MVCANRFPEDRKASETSGRMNGRSSDALEQGDANMLGMLAAILIILWLLGFFAFHVTTGLIHIVLVVGLILLVFQLLGGREG
jgi:hypothetical protein